MDRELLIWLIVTAAAVSLIGPISQYVARNHDKARVDMHTEVVRSLVRTSALLTPEQLEGEQIEHSVDYTLPGVYILFNERKQWYYTGQAENMLERVREQLAGEGNQMVYTDYLAGDGCTIRMIPLEDSGLATLDALERRVILIYKEQYPDSP